MCTLSRMIKLDLWAVGSLLMCAALLVIDIRRGMAEPKKNGVVRQNISWIRATDQTMIKRIGRWRVTRFRYAAADHLQTNTDGAALECRFRGTGLVIRLGNHAVPAYGTPNLGQLVVRVDDRKPMILRPHGLPREITIAQGIPAGEHRLRIEHRTDGRGSGCRIEGLRVLHAATGELRFTVNGEENAFLVDVRAVIRQGKKVIRNALVRNWLTGQCRLAGLPPGRRYSLELSAAGWKSARIDGINVAAGRPTNLSPVFLRRDDATRIRSFRFPALGRPAVRRPGESFRARFLGFKAKIEEVHLRRTVGPAVISRRLSFREDKAAAFYYDREIVVRVPRDFPPGLYDLSIKITGGRRSRVCRSPRSVHVVASYPKDPLFVTFGHLDTSGQNQAEYLERLATMINLLSPDMVLISNAVNPAYVSGALSKLNMPYVINFGNHQFPGHGKWYGDPVGLIDFGPHVCILNFGHPWHVGVSKADALLKSRKTVRCKVINAFEHNAPVASFLDKHGIRLIHDAHGTGKKVLDIGSTPTLRVGKVNASSFRVVRFRAGRVASCTYNGHETAPIPFGRDATPPLQVGFSSSNDGTHRNVVATITNNFDEGYPDCRITFVLPRGNYRADPGRVETSTTSDDGKYTILTVRADIRAKSSVSVKVTPRNPVNDQCSTYIKHKYFEVKDGNHIRLAYQHFPEIFAFFNDNKRQPKPVETKKSK